MNPEQQYIGEALAHLETHEVNGEYVNFENEGLLQNLQQ